MRIRPRGLVNSGNLCFANAVLQILVYCPPFWRFFTDLGRLLEPTEESKTPLVEATIRFVREFAPKERAPIEGKGKGVERYGSNGLVHEEVDEDIMDSFMPTYVHDALKEKKRFDHMRGGHQEDAEEFLGFYLDTLEEELLALSSLLTNPNPAPAQQNNNAAANNTPEDGWLEVGKRNRTVITRSTKTADSPMTRIFGGKFRSTLRVPHQRDSVIVEDWRSLRLDIQRDTIHTIKDALMHISTPQSVQVTSITRPGATLDATQQVHIDSLPPILILHLKRFLYDANKGGVAKVGKQVAFAPELEVGSEVMVQGRKVNGTRYRLFGALYHHGLSASGGHYTLDVLHPNIDMSTPPTKPREGWIRIDDELVSDLRAEDVFGSGGVEKDETMRCAYLLFYRRVGAGRG
jgi:ubiquitin carboxyl-terminal hydrolase 10